MKARKGFARRGFTLIEVLVVLAIVVLLTSVAYPNYAGSVVRMRRVEGETALIAAMQKQEAYRALHNTYAAFSADDMPAGLGVHWWSGSAPASSAYELDGQACPGAAIADCIALRARPGTGLVNPHAADADCGVLTLDSRGLQTAAGRAPRCWP
jgi:type IV pilus assembly protein PilE